MIASSQQVDTMIYDKRVQIGSRIEILAASTK